MKILAINAGSSSLKFQLLEMPEEVVITEGIVERIGQEVGVFTIKVNGEKFKVEQEISTHKVAVELLLNALIEKDIVSTYEEILGVGHRVVHGGELFADSAVNTLENIQKCKDLSDLAPLHNPANILGIETFLEILPNAFSVSVFDTAFHQTLDKVNYLYPTPIEWYENHQVRKYGFHGTSHKFVSQKASEILGNENAKVIVCHLGNGGSICAVDSLKSVDTTMGFTPLAGIPMGTRSGDIDPAIIEYMMKKEKMSIEEVMDCLNKKSGLLGMSKVSSDMRDIESAVALKNPYAITANDIFGKRIANYVAQYIATLNGCDAICFTAGIGENGPDIRREVVDFLKYFEIELDEKLNTSNFKGEISTPNSKIKVLLIPTNEEIVIARDTFRLMHN